MWENIIHMCILNVINMFGDELYSRKNLTAFANNLSLQIKTLLVYYIIVCDILCYSLLPIKCTLYEQCIL